MEAGEEEEGAGVEADGVEEGEADHQEDEEEVGADR